LQQSADQEDNTTVFTAEYSSATHAATRAPKPNTIRHGSLAAKKEARIAPIRPPTLIIIV